MKSLTLLWINVLNEMGTWCRTSTTRDRKTFTSRIEHEGISFLTISLPSFGSDFQKSLDTGRVDHSSFKGFAFQKGLPRFLGGFLDLVFERESGLLLDAPNTDAIFAIRQLTLMCSKVLIPCSENRVNRALLGYVECEQEVRKYDMLRTQEEISEFQRMSTLLWGESLSIIDKFVYDGKLIPSHGPGATADKLKGNQKFNQHEWTDRLEQYFPAGEFLLPNWRYASTLDGINFLEPGAERPVRVVTVPKTLKTPRIIAIEPTCMQYTQQALRAKLYEVLEDTNYVPGFLGFTDQVPNQDLAREGSECGNLATLDLSEASDRVSNQLVRIMLRRHPHLFAAVDATRSRKADVPGHGSLRLAKFASMGSALCFPIEAMVFCTIAFLGIQSGLSKRLSRKDIESFSGRVRIYGDDIIVPVEFVPSVIRSLETFGFKVNKDKSFWTGKFRESCGKEYYDGVDVSVVKARRVFPTKRKHVQEIISMVSLRNQLYWAGLWDTVRWMDSWLRSLIPLPVVLPSSPVLGRESVLGFETQRIHPRYHSPLVKGYVVSSVIPTSKLGEHQALLKCLLKQGREPFADVKHLERAGRPVAVDIKLRWASAI